MKKKVLSILLALALCLSLLPTAALADETGGTGASGEAAQMPAYSGGSGTKDDPWLISSVEDLQLLANTINDGKAAGFDANAAAGGKGVAGNYYGYYFKQTKDLDLSGIENWDPIGYSGGQDLYFAGHYDGDGHTISNAKSTGKKDTNGFSTAGVFGWVAFGSVKNLTVKNADFLATGDNNMSYAGGVLALAYSCTVENCSVYNSKIESRRDPNNSNYAGGITGIALTSSFEKCASVGNTIRHGSFGGGFIGALNRGGNSNFTNCYVANCIVTGCSDTGAMSTLSGGFLGASMGDDANAILNNCFVYNCAAKSDPTSIGEDYFAVFTYNKQRGKVEAQSCVYYYDANDATVNAEGAVSKTVDEFADGTVANLLGEAFAQGKLYPVFATDPADYSAVDAAIEKANALNESDYKDFAAVKAVLDAVVRDKKIAEQSEVDAMAQAIEDAIAALQYKGADYTKVDAAIAKANALNKDNYKDCSAVEAAVKAVVRDKNITEQSEVDAMAKAIEDAIAALEQKPSSGGDSNAPTYAIEVDKDIRNGEVTANRRYAERGDTVTITVTPDKGYTLETLTVTDKNGKEVKLTEKNGKYAFTMPASKVTVTATFMDDNTMLNFFVDVKASDYYYDAVLWAAQNGITSGTDAEHFSPNQPCTRAQIVTFLWRAAGSPEPKSMSSFSDVSADSYYAKAVAWAVENGITTGTGDGKFSPDATCTRAQSVTFLFRAIGKLVDSKAEFSDVLTDSYYANAVAWAVENGVTNGIGDGLFGPDNSCTRAQIVTFLYRAYQGK